MLAMLVAIVLSHLSKIVADFAPWTRKKNGVKALEVARFMQPEKGTTYGDAALNN